MKKKMILFFIVFVFCINLLPCYAMNTGVECTPLSQSKSSQVFSAMDIQYHAEDPKIKRRFQRFDINDRGEYALLFDNETTREYIVVYDENCNFQFALSWRGQRSCPRFEWDGEDLILYRAGTYAILMNRKGMALEVCQYYDRDAYMMSALDVNRREMEDASYVAEYPLDFLIKGPFYLGSYTKLVKITSENEKIVLFESAGNLFLLVTVLVLEVAVIVFAIRMIQRKIKPKT